MQQPFGEDLKRPPIVPVPFRSYFRAHKTNAAQNVAVGAQVTVQFNVEDYDGNGEYNPATDTFTPAATGTYLIGAFMNVGIPLGFSFGRVIINVNGADTVLADYYMNQTVGGIHRWINAIVPLNAGDNVIIIYRNGGGVGAVTVNPSAATIFYGHRLT
jgi:hypothetical protein